MMNTGVSDHAVLRFLERAYGLDVELVRAAIARATADARLAVADDIGVDVRFAVVIDRIRFVVDEGVVVTALGDRQRFNARKGSGT